MVERSFSYELLKLFFIITDLINTFCNFSRGVVAKHVLKKGSLLLTKHVDIGAQLD